MWCCGGSSFGVDCSSSLGARGETFKDLNWRGFGVLAAREKAVGALGEYFGNRVGECLDLQSKIGDIVPVGINGDGEWYHMASGENCADRPSRLDSSVADIMEGTEWQDGKSYLKLPFESWPWEREFSLRKIAEVIPC